MKEKGPSAPAGRSGGQEQQGLEGCMSRKMQKGRTGKAGAGSNEHEAEMSRSGGREQLLCMGLHDRDKSASQRGSRSDGHGRCGEAGRGSEMGMKPDQQESPGGDHGGGVEQC